MCNKSPDGVRKEDLGGQHETNAKSTAKIEETVKLLCMYEHRQLTHVEPTAILQENSLLAYQIHTCTVHRQTILILNH